MLMKATDDASETTVPVAEAVAEMDPESGGSKKYGELEGQTMSEDATNLPPINPPVKQQKEPETDNYGRNENWNHGLFDCFQVIFQPLFWMACCCGPIVTGQLMTRLRLNWCGQPDKVHFGAKTFSTVVVIFIVYLFTQIIGWGIVGLAFLVYMVIILSRTRGSIRRHFQIPAKTFPCADGTLEDACCGFWCGCCSLIQMARHTHNETKYPYEPCSTSGLPPYAPVVMERDDDEDTVTIPVV
ncbi:expressed unknown protein [Seminavis robusta]|uniref:Uncharacterized protein n=1 Tax=Seminavis robusta TaxID=568900 RepID=A0A9N8DAC9_9STRA|nr:expressed unknown protein [Seminavis robusta]|eukprot:Sro58_g033910.1 n/a (242) ;mRNA; r:128783-129606